MVLMIVSGRSGSGKSVALRALEDMGFYCVDNLPVVLLPDLARTLADREISAAVSHRSGYFAFGEDEAASRFKGNDAFHMITFDGRPPTRYEKAIFLCSNGARSNEQLFKGQ